MPKNGKFEWHVNPSTRPFVGGGAVIEELSETPDRTATYTGGGVDPENNTPAASSADREFTLGANENPQALQFDVSWGTPEDYDLELYLKQADGTLKPLPGSGKNPGTPEQVVLTGDQIVPGGTYVIRVVNFAAAVGEWTATVGLYSTTRTVTTGHPEAYTLTCEIDGEVKETSQVTVARGQELKLKKVCNGK